MTRRPERIETTPALMPLPVAVDLIRFEKNLLQIGFFGAHDTRHRNQSTRRIEQWVNRNGQKIKVAAEFRGSQEARATLYQRPRQVHRLHDKYIAFMKIAMEQKVRLGCLENPIRFTGYHMLKELGLTFSGENYEDINRWGQRMADASITSEQVIYLGHVPFSRAAVQQYRAALEEQGLAPSSINVRLDRSGDVPDGFASREELRRNLNLIRVEIVGSAKADTAPFGCLAAGPIRSRIRSRSNPAIPAKTVMIIVPDVGPRLRE